MREQVDVGRIGAIVGPPMRLEELKNRPGRRQTWRARGSLMSAIVKAYASDRACVVAQRVAFIGDGPLEPVVPRLLYVDPACHVLVLSDVPGRPLREAILAGDLPTCRRAGAVAGEWHRAWHATQPGPLGVHTVERELAILRERAASASVAVAVHVADLAGGLSAGWAATTVVHRDLYEEQMLIGDHVGLIDLDDAALGPPELDMGNLVAHVELLGRRRGVNVAAQVRSLLDGYAAAGPKLEAPLLERCRALALLRLACLNDDAGLIDMAMRAVAA